MHIVYLCIEQSKYIDISLPKEGLPEKKYRKAEYVQRRVCFVNVQSCLLENVVFSVCARMDNAAYIISVMWNSISWLDT